jgi:hypothetical protein
MGTKPRFQDHLSRNIVTKVNEQFWLLVEDGEEKRGKSKYSAFWQRENLYFEMEFRINIILTSSELHNCVKVNDSVKGKYVYMVHCTSGNKERGPSEPSKGELGEKFAWAKELLYSKLRD